MAKRLTDEEKATREQLRVAVGRRLRLVRRVLDMDQGAFAERAGIAANTYSQIENGLKFPLWENAIALCDEYKISMDWIFRGQPGDMSVRLWDGIKALQAAKHDS